MGYSNNQQFLPLTNDVNLYSDGCGETYDKKYYVNGAYIDLCGMSVEEYMKSPCCNGGGSNEPGSDDTKPTNVIQIVSYEENGFIFYQAIAKYPVTSNLKINVRNHENETITMLDLYIGESESKPEMGETLEIKDAIIDINEDEDFKYISSTGNEPDEPEIMKFNIYTGALLLSDIVNLEPENITNLTTYEVDGAAAFDVKFVIPASTIDTGDMEEDELNNYCTANQYGFIIVMPKEVYDSKLYTLFNYGGYDITNKFVFNTNYVINSEDFVCIIEKGTDDIMPYVPIFNEEMIYEYKLTIKK